MKGYFFNDRKSKYLRLKKAIALILAFAMILATPVFAVEIDENNSVEEVYGDGGTLFSLGTDPEEDNEMVSEDNDPSDSDPDRSTSKGDSSDDSANDSDSDSDIDEDPQPGALKKRIVSRSAPRNITGLRSSSPSSTDEYNASYQYAVKNLTAQYRDLGVFSRVLLSWSVDNQEVGTQYQIFQAANRDGPFSYANIENATNGIVDGSSATIALGQSIYNTYIFFKVYRIINGQLDSESVSIIAVASDVQHNIRFSDSDNDGLLSLSVDNKPMGETVQYDKREHRVTVRTPDDYYGEIVTYYRRDGSSVWSVSAPEAIGKYYVKLDISEAGKYWGETLEKDEWYFSIISTDLADADITLDINDATYNGSEQKARVSSVAIAGSDLTEDSDYTYTVSAADTGSTSDYTSAGFYRVTVTGQGDFHGYKTKDYEIKRKTINVTASDCSVSQGLTPDLTDAYSYEESDLVGDQRPKFSGGVKIKDGVNTDTVGEIDEAIVSDNLILVDDPGTGFKASNYCINFHPGKLTVTYSAYHTVTFDTRGGDPASIPPITQIGHGTTIQAPSDPLKTGYRFDSWRVSGNDAEFNFNNAINRDYDLYAKWDPVTYHINYVLNGGTWADQDRAPAVYTVESENGITFAGLGDPVRGGYAFDGWSWDGNTHVPTAQVNIPKGSMTGDITFQATWRADTDLTANDFIYHAPAESHYTGGSHEATFDVKSGIDYDISKITVKYTKTTESTNTAPTEVGDYIVSIDAAEYGKYKASSGIYDPRWRFTIGDTELPDVFSLSPTVYAYDGNEHQPDITCGSLTQGVHFDAVFPDDKTNIGTKTVTINGLSPYHGSKELTYTIGTKPLDYDENGPYGIRVVLEYDTKEYDGSAKEPTVTVTDPGRAQNDQTLVLGRDYTVNYENNVNATTPSNKAKVIINGSGHYSGRITKEFEITPKSLENGDIAVDDINGIVYDGTPKNPDAVVKDNGTLLVAGRDYTAVSTNNVNAGTATITFTGTGNYTGSTTKDFTIGRKPFSNNPNDPNGMSITVLSENTTTPIHDYDVFYYCGTTVSPGVIVKVGSDPEYTKTRDSEGDQGFRDNFICTCENNPGNGTGTGTITITGKEGGNYVGTATRNFNLYNASFKVTFDKNCTDDVTGLDYNEKIFTYNSSYGTLPDHTRTGYRFDGWYDAATGGTKMNDSGAGTTTVKLTNDATFYAHWTANTYSVILNKNCTDAGVPDPTSPVTVTYDGKYKDYLPVLSRTGYSFDGWYDAATGGNLMWDGVDADTQVKITAGKTFYAHWTAQTYTVTLNLNGGTPNSTPEGIDVTYAGAYSGLPVVNGANAPARTNYDFIGWYTAADGGTEVKNGDGVTITAPQTLYAHWKGVESTVTLDKNGGETEASPGTITVSYGGTYSELPTTGQGAPTKTGYSFAGWYTAATGGTKINNTDTVTIAQATTYYAHWTANSYTLTLDKDSENAVLSTTVMTVTYDLTYDLPVPTQTGYDFVGWYDGAVKIDDNRLTVNFTSAKTLKAHWSAKSINVYFDVNGRNTVAPGHITVSYDSTYASLSSVGNPGRTGYRFDGWYTKAAGGTQVTASTRVAVPEPHTLYAHWTPQIYTVTLSANGADAICSPTSIRVTYDSTYAELPTPSWKDRKFTCTGWYTDPAEGQGILIRRPDTVSITSDTTLYAHWTTTVFVRGIRLDKSTMTVKTKETGQLAAIIDPDDATDKSVTWRSENPEIASVDAGGLVSGHKTGQTVITVTASDPGETNDKVFSASCTVTVELGLMEDFPDSAGGKVTIVRDPETNNYTTLDGENVLVISREDGLPTDPPVHVFDGRRFRPGKGMGNYVIYHGIAYRYWHDYKIFYKRNRKAGSANAIVKWRKKTGYYQSGERKTKKDLIIAKRRVSDNSIVKVLTWINGRYILKIYVTENGVRMKATRKDFSYVRTPDIFNITFKRNFEGSVSVNRATKTRDAVSANSS